MTYPKFTVVTPTYNQGLFIEKTIDSVLSQGFQNLEFIIIDGGSKDNTVEIIKKYKRHLSYWVSEPDRGQSHAINKGMARATGEILTWLNSDDWHLPGTLTRFAEVFESHPETDVIVGAGRIVDEIGREIYYCKPSTAIDLETMFGWMEGGNFMQPSAAFRRKAWEKVGGLDESIHIALDVDLWLRMASAGLVFEPITDLLSEALSHPQAKTTAYRELMRMDCSIVIIRHGGIERVRPLLEKTARQYAWLKTNYEAIIGHPVMRLLRPVIKRITRDGEYWSAVVPPWVKD